MKLPFPKSMPLLPTLFFLSVLLAVQLIEGTDPVFAILMMAAQLFGIMAFNTLGGMQHPTGAFCLFSLVQNVTVPELAHAFVLQPGDYHLLVPLQAAGVCAVFYASLLVAASFVVLMPTKAPYFDRVSFSKLEIRLICRLAPTYVIAIILWQNLTGHADVENGSLLAFLNHFTILLLILAMVLSVQQRLKETNRKSSADFTVIAIFCFGTFIGIMGASKQGMLTWGVCWLLVCAAYGYQFKRSQLLMVMCAVFITWFYVYPFSQRARNAIHSLPTYSEKIAMVGDFLLHPENYPEDDSKLDANTDEFGDAQSKLSIVQRYSLLYTTSTLVDGDNRGGFTGIGAHLPAFFAIIPHFLWPDRPDPIVGNGLARKAGISLAVDDTSTGITLGSPATFYDIAGWLGLPVYTFLGFGLFFFALRALFGTVTNSMWALMVIASQSNDAGGAMFGDLILRIYSFISVFFILVITLKVISFISESMATRRTAQ